MASRSLSFNTLTYPAEVPLVDTNSSSGFQPDPDGCDRVEPSTPDFIAAPTTGRVAFARFWQMTLSDVRGEGGKYNRPPASNLCRSGLRPTQGTVARELIRLLVH